MLCVLNHDSMIAMNKTEAIQQLGGSVAAAAKAVGVTYQAVNQWPERLSRRVVDRVEAALWRAQRAADPLGGCQAMEPTAGQAQPATQVEEVPNG